MVTDDRNTAYLDKQYMMGDSLLVAPIFNDKSIAQFYLPEGKWTNYFSGKTYEGGKWYKEECGYLEIPLLARENSIVAINPDARALTMITQRILHSVYSVSQAQPRLQFITWISQKPHTLRLYAMATLLISLLILLSLARLNLSDLQIPSILQEA